MLAAVCRQRNRFADELASAEGRIAGLAEQLTQALAELAELKQTKE
jgi:hypothetical protein